MFTAKNYSLLIWCVCCNFISSSRGGSGGDCSRRQRQRIRICNIGMFCFTAGLHSWGASHKVNTKFPF
jgi:tellurite resistance protein TehA-like permease